jgi:hypothetical protein
VTGGADYKDVYTPGLEIGKCVVTVTAEEGRLETAASILAYHGAQDNDPAHRH